MFDKKTIKSFSIFLALVFSVGIVFSIVYSYLENERMMKQIQDVKNKEETEFFELISNFLDKAITFDMNDYKFKNVEGVGIEYSDEIQVFAFKSVTCPACKDSIEPLRKIEENYKVYKFFNSDIKSVKDFYGNNINAETIILLEDNQNLIEFMNELNIQFVPVFLFVQNGVVKNAVIGVHEYEIFEEIIKNIENANEEEYEKIIDKEEQEEINN